MKAICIQDEWQPAPGCMAAPKVPVYGEEVTITAIYQDEGIYLYNLKGYIGAFDQAGFMLTSSIDETEFKRQYNLKSK